MTSSVYFCREQTHGVKSSSTRPVNIQLQHNVRRAQQHTKRRERLSGAERTNRNIFSDLEKASDVCCMLAAAQARFMCSLRCTTLVMRFDFKPWGFQGLGTTHLPSLWQAEIAPLGRCTTPVHTSCKHTHTRAVKLSLGEKGSGCVRNPIVLEKEPIKSA